MNLPNKKSLRKALRSMSVAEMIAWQREQTKLLDTISNKTHRDNLGATYNQVVNGIADEMRTRTVEYQGHC